MDQKQCDVCQSREGKYVCPKCNLLYCSVDCFRAEQHVECSEIFYKKCVEEELRFKNEAPGINNIAEILLRSQNAGFEDDLTDSDDSDDSQKFHDLSTRLENIDLNNEEEIWNKLNAEERREFKKLISSGNIRNLLPEWQPWWEFYKSKKLISEVGSEVGNSDDEFVCPDIALEVPAFSELTKRTPAANIPFMIANLLMSYACTARWFKGKHCDMPVEGITMLFALSATIRNNKAFESLVEAYIDFENDAKNCKWVKKNEIDFDMISNDIEDFIKGQKGNETHFSVKACLCDIHNTIKLALRELQGDQLIQFSRFTGSPPSQQQLKLLSKKIIYYVSWINTYGEQLKCILP